LKVGPGRTFNFQPGICNQAYVNEQPANGVNVSQVVVLAAGDDDFGCATRMNGLDEMGTEKTASTGNDDSFIVPEVHRL
jgi:hypothetical protein